MRFKVWFGAQSFGTKLVLVAVAALIALPGLMTAVAVPAAFVSAVVNGPQEREPLTLVDNASNSTPVPMTAPIQSTANVTELDSVPYRAVSADDGAMAAGTTSVTTIGVPGTIERVYLVTYLDGIESGRELVSETVTVAPVDQVTSIGTYVAPPPPPVASSCDSNYADACVPISSDVDCAGGSGNGPAYVSGIVRVIGSDIYDLDRDGDGYGCD